MASSEIADRGRVFAAILWQESAPENWRQIVQDMHVCCAVSPLHDRDVYDEDGEPDEAGNPSHKEGDPKKPHWHLMWMFDGKKSVKQVLKMAAKLGIHWVEMVDSLRGYSRYLCHLDEPQEGVAHPKFVYPISEIQLFCGASIDLSKALSGEELKRVRAEVLDWIRATACTEYADLVDHAMDYEPDWLEYVCNKTTFLTGYLGSKRGKAKARAEAAALLRVDPETGEVCDTDGE